MAKQKGAAASVQPAGVKSGRFQKLKREFKRDRQLWIISILALAFMVVFYLLPMLGNYMAFIDYKARKGFFGSEFVGLKYFKQFFSLPDVWLVIRNTLVMGGLNITIGFVAPIILALMLNELRFKTMKRVLQTVSYLPHFVSWVVVASLAMSLFSTDGIVNEVLINMGLLEEPVNIVTKGDTYWIFITALNIWKTMGWSSIIYMSAMAGIDQEPKLALWMASGVGEWCGILQFPASLLQLSCSLFWVWAALSTVVSSSICFWAALPPASFMKPSIPMCIGMVWKWASIPSEQPWASSKA